MKHSEQEADLIRFATPSSANWETRKALGLRSRKGACEGVFSNIPAGLVGPGGYTFRLEITGHDAGPLVHEAGIAASEERQGAPAP